VVDPALAAYLAWPGAHQVFQLQRRVVMQATGVVREETVYGISSLARKHAGARWLARYVRQHWHIENRSHWVRDVTFGEDAGRVRTAPIPQVLAALRNVAIGLLHAHGLTRIKAATLDLQANPWEALELLGITRDN
jgi:predicted transposase YbfD/YdcC